MNEEELSGIEVITGNQLARADEVLPGVIHLLPVAARPFFPGQAVPLLRDARAWNQTIDAVAKSPIAAYASDASAVITLRGVHHHYRRLNR